MDARYRAVTATPPALRHRAGMLRMLAVIVLAGLWLMHGASATTEAGCHGVPVVMSMDSSPVGSSSAAAGHDMAGAIRMGTGDTGAAAVLRSAGTGASDHSGMGEACMSGQPPSPSELLLALLGLLALAGLVFGMPAQLIRPLMRGWSRSRRRGPPGPAGMALLITVCVSRT